MNKILTALICFLCIFSYSQNQRFIYEYRFVSDSISKDQAKNEIMYLDIVKKGSKFYSREKAIADSIKIDRINKKIQNFSGINFDFVPFVVEKAYPSYKILFFNSLEMDKYKVTDDRIQNWKILPVKEKIGEFNSQKATLDFAGRQWTAWFVTEIPVQDGPYKFHGLPGLIVKIEDQTKSHSFILKGIKKLNAEYDWASEGERKEIGPLVAVNTDQYRKQFIENRNNPVKGIRQMVSSNRKIIMMDENGKKIDAEQAIRDQEKRAKAENAKNNNIIEIDLLK